MLPRTLAPEDRAACVCVCPRRPLPQPCRWGPDTSPVTGGHLLLPVPSPAALHTAGHTPSPQPLSASGSGHGTAGAIAPQGARTRAGGAGPPQEADPFGKEMSAAFRTAGRRQVTPVARLPSGYPGNHPDERPGASPRRSPHGARGPPRGAPLCSGNVLGLRLRQRQALPRSSP